MAGIYHMPIDTKSQTGLILYHQNNTATAVIPWIWIVFYFILVKTRGAKTLLSSRDAYVDSAVGYVEVKREAHSCVVKGRVTPEHRVKAKLYMVTAIIEERDEKIISLTCHDCAASAGGCKHVICFTIWLIKRSDEPPVTSTVCYWSKPKLAGAVGEREYILAKNMGIKKKVLDTEPAMTITLSMFAQECKRRKLGSGMILNYCGNHRPMLTDFCIFNLVLQFTQLENNHSYENFKQFAQKAITLEVINNISEATKDQADSKLWHSLRQDRVTGSRIYEAVHCKTENGTLVQSILGGYKVPETKSIKRGKVLEKKVKKELEKEFGTIQNSGFILISPLVGVSPDGFCKDFILEIKCTINEKTIKTYVKDGILQEKSKAQIMVQMHAAHKAKGLFCVADPNFEQTKLIHKYWVEYDKNYTKTLLNEAEEFWKSFIFKTVLESAK